MSKVTFIRYVMSREEAAAVVKRFHGQLRTAVKQTDAHTAWREHLDDVAKRLEYAEAMSALAKAWRDASTSTDRMDWIIANVNDYLVKGLAKARRRERLYAPPMPFPTHPLNVLDVGSCDAGLAHKWNEADVVSIDLTPATSAVYACDFINVPISDITSMKDGRIVSLAEASFDAVVFSLFLEYLPTAEMRRSCCATAARLLRPEGVLVVVTPDSNHVGSNAHIYRAWQRRFASLGLTKVRHEKLTHLRCMLYRKAINANAALEWLEQQGGVRNDDDIHIPQDFSNVLEEQKTPCRYEYDSDVIVDAFLDLPLDC